MSTPADTLPAPVAAPPVTDAAVMARANAENFPVALRLLPRAERGHLLAVYGFARLADQLGDAAAGDRRAHLDWLEHELRQAYAGRATHPTLARLTPTLHALALPEQPFLALIEANRREQTTSEFATVAELVASCRYSANPIGRLVLAVFRAATPVRVALADRVCTGLQLVEHAQDVGEDFARGHVYLPAEDLTRFACPRSDLARPAASPALKAVVALQCARARAGLEAARPLTASLTGWARVAVAGYAAGGLAALDAVEAADFDVLAVACRPARARTARHAAVLLTQRRDGTDGRR